MLTKADKEKLVADIGDALNQSQIVFCVDYLGLTVKQVTQFRDELRAVGAESKVIRNTLAKIASKNVYGETDAEDAQKFADLFEGPSLIVFGKKDAVASAKIIAKYAKEIECFAVKGGWFSNSFIDETGVEKISTMPSREEILSTLLRLISTPATQLVRLIKAPSQQVVQVLAAHQKNLT